MSKNISAVPVLKKVAQFQVGDQIFTSQKEAMRFIHSAAKKNAAVAICTPPVDDNGVAQPITGLYLGQKRNALEEMFSIGTIQREKKAKVHEKVEAALNALLEEFAGLQADNAELTLADFMVTNEERFENALRASRPPVVLTDERKAEMTARLAEAREKRAAEKAAKDAAEKADKEATAE